MGYLLGMGGLWVLGREAVVSSVPVMTGQCDSGGCGCVLLLGGMGSPR